MRVAMFTELTRKNGSSRVVCYQFEDYLRRHGISVRFYPPSSIKAYELFHELLASTSWLARLRRAVYWYLLVFPVRLLQIAAVVRYDVVFLQRGLLNASAPPLLEWLLYLFAKKLLHKPLVYALDDAQYLYFPQWYFHARFKMADWVFTGNEHIAGYARRFNPRVFVLASVVDTARFRPKQHVDHTPVVIGWTGTLLDDGGYLATIVRAMQQLSLRHAVIFEVVSNRSFTAANPEIRVRNTRWRLELEEEQLGGFDIGIMPLLDDEFARSKESYKLKQYMAAGLPVVCSPVGQNLKLVQEGLNGFFASSEEEWVEKLGVLVEDWKLRAEMGKAGREFLEERYSLAAAAPQMAGFLWKLYREGTGRLNARAAGSSRAR